MNTIDKAQASTPRPAALYISSYPSHRNVFPFNELRLELAVAWPRNRRAGSRLEQDGVLGSIRSFHGSAEGTTADLGTLGRRNCMALYYKAGIAGRTYFVI